MESVIKAKLGKCESPLPNPVCPELVEGLLFFQAVVQEVRSKEQRFDKLSIVGFEPDNQTDALDSMADETLDPFARRATQEAIIARRDRVLAERTKLFDHRADILARIRQADRELADCRAAARLFDLDVEFPEEDERMVAQRREIEYMTEREERLRREENRRRMAHARSPVDASIAVVTQFPPFLSGPGLEPVSAPVATPSTATVKRPPIRRIILRELERAGTTGAKAADLRDFIERSYGGVIHEKTVGMTLYRLSQDDQVRREGHTWFFGSAPAETENPGLEGPGSVNLS